jgi:alpha-N-arabinofuranosidase
MRALAILALTLVVLPALTARGAVPEVSLTVDPERTGAAISPYLYGQFIEHLGRCIRQGLWAEMLRDRKFLQEPGKSWEVVKPAGATFEAILDPAAAYAGDHGMALRLGKAAAGGPCGIRQAGIGVVSGKEYVGYAYLAHAGAAAPVEVRLQWGDTPAAGQTIRLDPGATYRKLPFTFKAGATTDNAVLSLTLTAPGHLWVGCVSLMPAENIGGMRPDTLGLVKQIAPPITRWPGGNFVSGYNWKDGIGPRDRRPPRWERAWSDIEDNDFGLDEFMAFCREVNTEPYICVNAGLGGVAEAAEQVQYANGSEKTRWGAARAANGVRRPYGVVWWGVGNEMFGDWQLGNIPVDRYADRHNAFVAAMKAEDAGIKIIAVGAPGPWNDAVAPRCAASMDLLSGHHYSGRGFRLPMSPEDAAKYAAGFPKYSASVADGIRAIVEDFRKRLGQGNAALDRVRLAIDEWGIVRDWNGAPDGPGIGAFEHYYTMGDAVAVARGMHELLRNADVVTMANWAQLVNVIATIKTSRTDVAMDPAGYVLSVYRGNLLGNLLTVDPPKDVPLDVVASRDASKKLLAVALVNHSTTDSVRVKLDIKGANLRAVQAWTLTSRFLTDTNVPGRSEDVRLTATRGIAIPGTVEVPKHSVMVIRYDGELRPR